MSCMNLISDRSAAYSGTQSRPIATGLVKNWKENTKAAKVAKLVKMATASIDVGVPVLGGLNDEDAFATKPKFKARAKVHISDVPKFDPSTVARDMSQKNNVSTKTILSLV